MIASTLSFPAPPIAALQHAFLAILPHIEQHARVYFRHVRCPHKKDDCVAETIALAWSWFVRLAQRGKDSTEFASALASLAARAVKSGRRVCGQERARDVMSPLAQQRHGFVVKKLPDVSTLCGNPYDEALADNTQTPVPEQAAFRTDFPRWRCSYPARDRDLIDRLMLGERTKDVANELASAPVACPRSAASSTPAGSASAANCPTTPTSAAPPELLLPGPISHSDFSLSAPIFAQIIRY